jgi:pimeloyl-ACP methyl ester carboxylesterase
LLAGELDDPEVLWRNRFLAARISSAEEKLIVRAGHNGPMENPAAFLDATKSFLATIAPE